jgi:hypothetical protein
MPCVYVTWRGVALRRPAARFFLSNLCRVEIARGDSLHRVHFPKPVLANYLTEKTKEETLWSLPRDSSSDKVNGLFSAANDIFDEMKHQYTLRKYGLVSWMVSSLPTMSTIAFTISIIINALLLVSVSVGRDAAAGGDGADGDGGGVDEDPTDDPIPFGDQALGLVMSPIGPLAAPWVRFIVRVLARCGVTPFACTRGCGCGLGRGCCWFGLGFFLPLPLSGS